MVLPFGTPFVVCTARDVIPEQRKKEGNTGYAWGNRLRAPSRYGAYLNQPKLVKDQNEFKLSLDPAKNKHKFNHIGAGAARPSLVNEIYLNLCQFGADPN